MTDKQIELIKLCAALLVPTLIILTIKILTWA